MGPVAPALAVPLLLAPRRLPVALLRFPPRPSPRRLPAAGAAIALPRLHGMKLPLTPFEQTPASPGPPAHCWLPPTLLIFALTCSTLGKAHGRLRLPEAQALEGNLLLSGAHQTSGSRQINTVTENCPSSLRPRPALSRSSQILSAWVILGKQTWVTSRKRRSFGLTSAPNSEHTATALGSPSGHG